MSEEEKQPEKQEQPQQEQQKKPVQITINQADLQRLKLQQEDVDFMGDCKAALLAKSTPLARGLLYFVILFFCVGLIWAGFAKLDEVTRGMGQIIPNTKVQIIQNLEGGILQKIYVQEGTGVKKGQLLAQLSKVQFAAQYQEGYAKYLTMLAAIARLKAEVAPTETIKFPPELANRLQLKKHEIMLFKSRIQHVRNMLHNLNHSYKLANKELYITKPLVAKGVMSKIELLRLEREIANIKSKIDSVKDGFREKALTELAQVQAGASALSEQLAALKDRMVRTTIKSPVAGIVKQIYVNTLGGIVQPGMPIMEILPSHGNLIIEAQIKPENIAFIKVGQRATIRVTAYDYAVYGSLKAVVTHVSSDSSTDKYGNSFYQVDLKTDKDYLGTKPGKFPLKVGMQAMVDIVTGKKSVLVYLMKPILRAKEKAMRER